MSYGNIGFQKFAFETERTSDKKIYIVVLPVFGYVGYFLFEDSVFPNSVLRKIFSYISAVSHRFYLSASDVADL